MIAHLVLFRPRTDLTAAERDALLRAIEDARRQIPSIRRFRIGHRLRAARPGGDAGPGDYPYLAILEFDDPAGLAAYLTHPAHAALARLWARASAATVATDYELADAADVRRVAESLEPGGP